jgi:thiol-disulfide isomerase/thioredoxin
MASNDSVSYFEGSAYVKELTPKDFDGISTWKLKDTKCAAIFFYAPWCPHCKAVKEDWIKFGKTATFMDVLSFNCEKYSAYLLKIKEDIPNLVRGFPTIIYYVNGSPMETFEGERSYTNLLKKGMNICQGSH